MSNNYHLHVKAPKWKPLWRIRGIKVNFEFNWRLLWQVGLFPPPLFFDFSFCVHVHADHLARSCPDNSISAQEKVFFAVRASGFFLKWQHSLGGAFYHGFALRGMEMGIFEFLNWGPVVRETKTCLPHVPVTKILSVGDFKGFLSRISPGLKDGFPNWPPAINLPNFSRT